MGEAARIILEKMKTLNRFIIEHSSKIQIIEKLKLSKDSKIINDQIDTKFDSNITFTQKEIDIVQKYAQKLKVKPVILTNYSFTVDNTLKSYASILCIYFNEDWDSTMQHTYLLISKIKNDSWGVMIVTNERSIIFSQTTYNKFENVEDICKQTLKYLDEHDEFYKNIKK